MIVYTHLGRESLLELKCHFRFLSNVLAFVTLLCNIRRRQNNGGLQLQILKRYNNKLI
jgi:hypothetical protein